MPALLAVSLAIAAAACTDDRSRPDRACIVATVGPIRLSLKDIDAARSESQPPPPRDATERLLIEATLVWVGRHDPKTDPFEVSEALYDHKQFLAETQVAHPGPPKVWLEAATSEIGELRRKHGVTSGPCAAGGGP